MPVLSWKDTLYDDLYGFKSEREEQDFLKAKKQYMEERKEFYLQNPTGCDLDVLSFEDGQLATFIKEYRTDPMEAARRLWLEVEKQAQRLAEEDADEATFDKIIGGQP